MSSKHIGIITVISATLALLQPGYAAMVCKVSLHNGGRMVPDTYAGESSTSARIAEVPDIPDNFDTTPGAFRLAYFHVGTTEAYYTSRSGTGLPTIRWQGPRRDCGGVTK
jgi:hypothetical protein